MFIGLTQLYVGNQLIGDISEIHHDGDFYIFTMYDTKNIYKTDKLKYLDIMRGAGDRIVIPEDKEE